MGRKLFAATACSVFLELVVLPTVGHVIVDRRWSPLTFCGALMFIVACANVIFRAECLCLPDWLNPCYVRSVLGRTIKFLTPWILFRLIWTPVTRYFYLTVLAQDHGLPLSDARAQLQQMNVVVGASALVLSLLYQGQLDCFVDISACWLRSVCGAQCPLNCRCVVGTCCQCRRPPRTCACPRLIDLEIIQEQLPGCRQGRVDVTATDPGVVLRRSTRQRNPPQRYLL